MLMNYSQIDAEAARAEELDSFHELRGPAR